MLNVFRRLLDRRDRSPGPLVWSTSAGRFVPLVEAGGGTEPHGEDELAVGIVPSSAEFFTVQDVAAIGFLPLEADASPDRLAKLGSSLPPRLRAALWLMRRTSNEEPPGQFGDFTAFRAYLGKRDYRGASWLRDLHVYRSKGGRVLGLRGLRGWHVGFTRYRRLGNIDLRGAGVGRLGKCGQHLNDDGTVLTIWQTFAFKIGRLGNLVGAALIGHLAPWAFMRIEYTIHGDGNHRIDVASSAVPAQHLYVGWQRRDVYDQLDGGDFEDFVGTGNCQYPPWTVRLRWPAPPGSSA